MPRNVISFGEALWDLLPDGPVLGGAPCNLAARVNELGDRALLVSRVGDDARGTEALAQMRSLGLDTTHVQVDRVHPTGIVEITLDANRQPDYEIIRNVAYDYIETNAALLDAARNVDCICFGVLAQRNAQSRETLAALLDATPPTALKLLDINLRKNCYTPETVADSLRHADVLKLNEDEVRMLGEMLAMPMDDGLPARAEALCRTWGIAHCIVTLAERGALCVSVEGEVAYEPGYQVQLVDPCGSGDAFSAAFLHRLLSGASVRECLRLGNLLGAAVATQHGATQRIERALLEQLESGAIARTTDPALTYLLNY